MGDADLCYVSATEALARFKARKLSPVELVDALVARAGSVAAKVNPFTDCFFERAREAARKAEARYMKSDGRLRPLEGLTIVIKDETAVAGERTTYGSRLFATHVDTETSPVAERVFKAGAIMLARTTVPEFCCTSVCWSPLWGVTRSPWNLRFSSAGSSGGAGAALAAGLATLADGSDLGGSIRMPASACGVYGFKPPYGRNPEQAPLNLDWYCHVGPLARSVADCALVQNVMAGPHPRDIAAIRPKLRIPSKLDQGVKGWRIAYSPGLDIFAVDREVAANTRAAADAFRALGATVDEVRIGWTREILDAAIAHYSAIFGAWINQYGGSEQRRMAPYTRAFARRARRVKPVDLVTSMAVEGRMFERLGALFQRYRLLLCPTLAAPSLRADHDPSSEPVRINGKPRDAFFDFCMAWPFNMMSRCPVMSVPSGFAKSGVPTGLQIVGRPFDDVSVFRAAAAFEPLHPLYDRPSRRPKL